MVSIEEIFCNVDDLCKTCEALKSTKLPLSGKRCCNRVSQLCLVK